MCGINGYLNFRTQYPPEHIQQIIGKMNNALVHRGPDNQGQWRDPDNFCHLGHTRLSILDLSSAGHQPMSSEDGRFVISFNGEIYNFKELRLMYERKGQQFKTGTDTEILLHAFTKLGPVVFQALDGQFAVAIYDRQKGIVTLARDRIGEKPLYYAIESGFCVFSSELKALLEVDQLDVQLSEEALTQYLTLRYVPPPKTILDPIKKLPPGFYLQIDRNGNSRVERYYSFEIDQDNAPGLGDLDTYCDEVEEALIDSLKVRLNSDVPIGVFLSSGVDSSLVCALLSKKLDQNIKTYTIGFSGDENSEHHAAESISKELGTDHSTHIFSASNFDVICDKIGDILDEPNGDRSCVPTYLLSEFTRQHVKVAISGDAGDELFGGYGRYPGVAKSFDGMAPGNARQKVKAYIEQGLPVFPPQAVQAAFPDAFEKLSDFYEAYAPAFAHIRRPSIHALRQLDLHTYLPGAVLAKVDRMSMQHSLEVRTPFLSPKMLALASKASEKACWSDGIQKVVLRRILSKYLPDQHVYAPKQGFGMPSSVFFNNKQRIEAELRTAYHVLRATNFFQSRHQALDAMFGSVTANINSIWAVVVLSKWIQSINRAL